MKKHRYYLPLFFLLPICLGLQAQPNKKVGPALQKFINTEFMTKFRDLRINAESAVLRVQSNQNSFDQTTVFRLRSTYDQSATRANKLLSNIKQDFLNKKKLKTIAAFPEMYSDGLRFNLQELSDYYSANFQQALADAEQADQVDGAVVLLLLTELIGLSKGLADYFGDMRREARQYTETHLQEHLIQPYRWRYWDELAGSTSPYEQFDKKAGLERSELSDAEFSIDQGMQQSIEMLPLRSPDDTMYNFDEINDSTDTTGTAFEYEDWTPNTPPAKDRTRPATKPAGKPSKAPVAQKKKPIKPTQKH